MEIPEANDDNVFTLPSGVTVIPPGVSLPLDDAVAALVDGVVLSYLVVSDAVGAHPLSLWAWTTPKKDVAK
jgi:hypothetical protein